MQLARHFSISFLMNIRMKRKAYALKKLTSISNGSTQIGGFAFGVNLGYAF